jgi:hypothetical protein
VLAEVVQAIQPLAPEGEAAVAAPRSCLQQLVAQEPAYFALVHCQIHRLRHSLCLRPQGLFGQPQRIDSLREAVLEP